jgi:hypothetical protein
VIAAWSILALLVFDPKLSTGGDDATYVLLAKSLASGHGFVEQWTPGTPAHTQYPFGFPLLLAPFVALGMPFAALKVVTLTAALVSLWLVDRLLGRTILLLVALNAVFLSFSHLLLSELPFLALTLGALASLEAWRRSARRAPFALAVFLAVAAMHVRSAGLALVAGALCWLVRERRFRAAGAFAAGTLVLCLPWLVRNGLHPESGSYWSHVRAVDPYNRDLGTIDATGLLQRVIDNVVAYGGKHLPDLLAAGVPLGAIFVTLPAIVGLIVRFRRGAAAHDWVLACTLAMLLVYPSVWGDARMVLPVLPFLLLAALTGWRLILRHRVAFALIMLLPSLFGTLKEIPANLGMISDYMNGDRLAGYPPAYRSFFMASAWVAENTLPDAIVVSRKPTLFALSSGRRVFCYPFTSEVDKVRAALFKADFVMIEPISNTGERYLRPALEPLVGERLTVVHRAGEPPVHALAVKK